MLILFKSKKGKFPDDVYGVCYRYIESEHVPAVGDFVSIVPDGERCYEVLSRTFTADLTCVVILLNFTLSRYDYEKLYPGWFHTAREARTAFAGTARDTGK